MRRRVIALMFIGIILLVPLFYGVLARERESIEGYTTYATFEKTYWTTAVFKVWNGSGLNGGFRMYLFLQDGSDFPPSGAWKEAFQVYIFVSEGIKAYAELYNWDPAYDQPEGSSPVEYFEDTFATKICGLIILFDGGMKGGNHAHVKVGYYGADGEKIGEREFNMGTWSVNSYYLYTRYRYGAEFWIESYGGVLVQYQIFLDKGDCNIPMPQSYRGELRMYAPADLKANVYSWQMQNAENESLEVGWDDSKNVMSNNSIVFMLNYSAWELLFVHKKIVSYNDVYTMNTTKPRDLGDWGMWNWARDGLVAIVNVFQYIYFYLSYAIWQFVNLLYYLLLLMAFVVWEGLKYLYYAGGVLVWFVGYGLYFVLYLLVQGIVLVDNYALPLMSFILNIMASIMAFLWATVVSSITGGDFWEIYNIMYSVLSMAFNGFIIGLEQLIIFLPDIILAYSMLLSIMSFVLLSREYARMKGWSGRVRQLDDALKGMLYPFSAIYELIVKLKEVLLRWL